MKGSRLQSGQSAGPRQIVMRLLLVATSLLLLLPAGGWLGRFRINMTPSAPLGLWQITPLGTAVEVGDRVFVCLPDNSLMREALDRGYLRRGLCPSGVAPMIKTVEAVAGQRVTITDHVVIDGRFVARSQVRTADGQGRLLLADHGGVVPIGAVFLHSPFAGSWDSRYFGAVPLSGIIGRAEEVVTYGP